MQQISSWEPLFEKVKFHCEPRLLSTSSAGSYPHPPSSSSSILARTTGRLCKDAWEDPTGSTHDFQPGQCDKAGDEQVEEVAVRQGCGQQQHQLEQRGTENVYLESVHVVRVS